MSPRVLPLCIAVLMLAAMAAGADSSATSNLDSYRSAITQPNVAMRAAALESFLSAAPASSLRKDAVFVLAWSYQQSGDINRARAWARELGNSDPGNPLALAIEAEAERRQGISHIEVPAASEALTRLSQMTPPEGMSAGDFAAMRLFAHASLVGAVGDDYLAMHEYAAASQWLRQAAQQAPGDPHYAYALALADLSGKDPNPSEGYWYLAKAVDLTKGTPAGAQIADYARTRYREDGGSDGAWNQFLLSASASMPAAPRVVETAVAASSSAAKPAAAAVVPASAVGIGTSPKQPTSAVAESGGAGATPKPDASSAWEEPKQVADLSIGQMPMPKPERRLVAPGAPVSVGVLLETSLLGSNDRKALVGGLDALARHLREYDEAFILSFDRGLVMDQDLTANPRLLEDAVRGIKPHSGSALLDAVTFSAGHLGRIARTSNRRVLVVISDGQDVNSKTTSADLNASVTRGGVLVYCIGVGVGDRGAQARLQALANATGGDAVFVSDAQQIGQATSDIASRLGMR